MPSHKLSNYLRTCRKRSSLSQDDMAFLFGVQSGSKICRYERFTSTPTVAVALAYAFMFQSSVRELFGGLSQSTEQKVIRRAAILCRRIEKANATRRQGRKLEWLRALLARNAIQMNPNGGASTK